MYSAISARKKDIELCYEFILEIVFLVNNVLKTLLKYPISVFSDNISPDHYFCVFMTEKNRVIFIYSENFRQEQKLPKFYPIW